MSVSRILRYPWTKVTLIATFATIVVGCQGQASSQPPTESKNTRQFEDDKQTATNEGDPTEREDDEAEHPFVHRLPIPDFPKDATWLNTGGPLRKADLKGKFVILDFWTYCCINCIHILPELKKLEKAYPDQLVVIGVHSAKFETEKDSKNIQEAVLRYEIEHPVINDSDHKIWNSFGVRSWPTMLMIDPEGNAVWGRGGEVRFETIDAILKDAIPYYRKKKLLDETPIHFDLIAHRQENTPLRFPGKVLADEKKGRLFISDSNHNRIVVTDLEGKLIDIIGNGAIGNKDGGFDEAMFDHPQGMALAGETLYLADTENHLVRKIDLESKQVSTIAGIGEQARSAWPGLDDLGPTDDLPERWVGSPLKTALNSPWALWIRGEDLFIAMAGPHQIWKLKLDGTEVGPYAGNGREDIVDGPLLPQRPYDAGFSSFAQPSGLASDGEWLFVADSEGSSIRAVPFDPEKEVRTVVGTADLAGGRLFEFGDVDGPKDKVLLQHALGVVYDDGKIYITDTYNNKVKVVDAKTGETKTIAGTGEPGLADEPATFDEPAGITLAKGKLYIADTNNHAIRIVDPTNGKVSTLQIAGLESPTPPKTKKKPSFAGAKRVKVEKQSAKPSDNQIKLKVRLVLPKGWKINDLAPMGYFVEAIADSGPVDRSKLSDGVTHLKKPSDQFEITVPVTGEGDDSINVAMNYFYCQEGGEGICKVGSVVWEVPLGISTNADTTQKRVLSHKITP